MSQPSFREAIASEVLFCDGGMGTQLQAAGLKAGEASETWSLTHPETVIGIHMKYLEAGANIIGTDTFGVNGVKYPSQTVEQLVSAAVGCAKEAVRRFEEAHMNDERGREPHFIALSMGPTGKLLEPLGQMTVGQAIEGFGVSVRAAVAAGVDLISIETMNDIAEARAAVLAAKEYGQGMPVSATVVFNEHGRMLTGTDVATAAVLLTSLGADVTGLNCSLGPDIMKQFVPTMRETVGIPLSISPNAGLPRTENGVTVYPCAPGEFAREMTDVFESGARLLGGCCGTTPVHIRALREALSGRDLSVPFTVSGCPALLCGRLGTADPTDGDCQVTAVSLPACDEADDMADEMSDAVADAEDDGAEVLLLTDAPNGEMMAAAVNAVQSVSALPILLPCRCAEDVADALRRFNGRAGLLWVGDGECPADVESLAAHYGAIVYVSNQIHK